MTTIDLSVFGDKVSINGHTKCMQRLDEYGNSKENNCFSLTTLN